MSFGAKQYQHRFFTAPKTRSQRIDDSMSPNINRSRFQSAIGPPLLPHLQQSTLKQSYLRMKANQRSSRLHPNDPLGSQSLKFQKDVINRYSQDDYQQKADMLQRFKRQAEQLKRKKKYRHVSIVNKTENISNNNGSHFTGRNDDRMISSYRDGDNYSRVLQQNVPNQQSISLLPITNNKVNASRVTLVRQLRLPRISQDDFRDPVVEEDSSENQSQFIRGDGQIKETTFLSRVCDVGVTANLTADNQASHTNRTKTIEKHTINDQSPRIRKISQTSKVQMLKSKNNHMKKKYEKLKKQLSRKAKQLSKQKHISQSKEPDQQFQQKIQNLSFLIHTLCDKLRQNNSKMLVNINIEENSNHELEGADCNINIDNQNKNQTQINLSNPPVIDQQNEEMRMSKAMVHSKYESEIGKIDDDFIKARPRIVYTLNRDSKNVSFDPLKLLKNKVNEQTFLLNNDGFSRKRRIKTQNY